MASKSPLLTRGLANRGYEDQRTTRTSWTHTKNRITRRVCICVTFDKKGKVSFYIFCYT